MTTEHLIEKAHRAWRDASVRMPVGSADPRSLERGWIAAAIEAVESDIREEAHTPTNDEREELRRAIASVLWNAGNYPDRVQAALLGQSVAPLVMLVHDAVLAAGFRRSEVPEPSGEVQQVLNWIDHTLSLPMYQGTIEGEYSEGLVDTLRTVRKMLNGTTRPDASWRSVEPQGEPSDAQVEAVARALYESQWPHGNYEKTPDFNKDSWRHHARAALRAAGGVR